MASKAALGLLAVVTAVGTVGAYFALKDRIGPILGGATITMKVNPKTVRDGIDPINVEIELKNYKILGSSKKYLVKNKLIIKSKEDSQTAIDKVKEKGGKINFTQKSANK